MRANDHFSDSLGVVSMLANDSIRLSVDELRMRDKLTLALRASLRNGVDINDLSAASRLTVADIRARVDAPLAVLDETDYLAGVI